MSKKKSSNTEFWISPQQRVNFYLNNQDSFKLDLTDFERVKNETSKNKKEMRLFSYGRLKGTFLHWYCKYLVHLPRIRNIRILPYYIEYKNLHSYMNIFKPLDRYGTKFGETEYPLYLGETGSTGGLPCIRKSRRADDQTSVIYNFRTLRLTYPCFKAIKYDVPWEEKTNNVIWRGATTGKTQRVEFVKRYYKDFDVAFATIKQKPDMAYLQKSKVSLRKQLKYKFIISLEGNDVASNLRWILASNSIPIMTKPFWQSWIIEAKLEPYVHYLPLNEDMSNLHELLAWAEGNDEKCRQIAENGKLYMSQFLDEENDLPVQKLLLDQYAKRLLVSE